MACLSILHIHLHYIYLLYTRLPRYRTIVFSLVRSIAFIMLVEMRFIRRREFKVLKNRKKCDSRWWRKLLVINNKKQSQPSFNKSWLKKCSPIIQFGYSMNIYYISSVAHCALNSWTRSLNDEVLDSFPLDFFVDKDWKLICHAIIVERSDVKWCLWK